ncbi:MAG: fimbrillin family protein [Candidatus Cryptobacteroides sp.]|nr:fimbrillin family protein [Candidatus Cryptobacteroides sp.]
MKRILLFASAALLFAGCSKENLTPTENPDNSQKGDITLSFSASQTGFGTKAVIGETTTDAEGAKSTAINWQSTDKISVFDGDYKNYPFSTKDFSTETPTSCTFEGNVTKLAADYTAVYPYTEGAKISEGVISGVTLPATQTAVAGSFDPKAALMAAKTVEGGRDLAFKNLVGYVKVTTDFDCKQIELCAASGEKLAGAGTISFNEVTPSFALSEGAESTITLLPEVKGATIAAGTYYIAVPATTLAAGWSIRLTDTDDIVSTKKGSKDITFKQSTILNLGTISMIEPRYLTFSAESEQTFTMNFQPNPNYDAFTLGEGEYFEYRVGNGGWEKITETKSGVTFGGVGNDLQLRGISSNGTADSNEWGWTTISFENATYVRCSGDIRTLVNYKDYENANTSNARFCNLFNNCLQLTSAPDLPATELASYCYSSMFQNCRSLQTAPKELLPAMILADGCYSRMFQDCESLTTAPKLPAETLAKYCYSGMFYNCTSLKTVELPATTLAEDCYWQMFYNCSALQTVYIKAKPSLPDDIGCFIDWLDGAGNSLSIIYCYEEFYDFVKGASAYVGPLCPDYWSFYDIDNTESQWGQN